MGKGRAGDDLSPLGSLLSPLGSLLSPGILAGQDSRGDGSSSGASPSQEKFLQNRAQACCDTANYPLEPGMCLTTASRIILLLLGAASWGLWRHSHAQPSPWGWCPIPGRDSSGSVMQECCCTSPQGLGSAGSPCHIHSPLWESVPRKNPTSLTPLQSLQPSTSGMLGGSCSHLGVTPSLLPQDNRASSAWMRHLRAVAAPAGGTRWNRGSFICVFPAKPGGSCLIQGQIPGWI